MTAGASYHEIVAERTKLPLADVLDLTDTQLDALYDEFSLPLPFEGYEFGWDSDDDGGDVGTIEDHLDAIASRTDPEPEPEDNWSFWYTEFYGEDMTRADAERIQVTQHAARISENTDRYLAGRITWAEWDERQRALWDAVPPSLSGRVASYLVPLAS